MKDNNIETEETTTIKIFHDGVLVKEFNNQTSDFPALKYIQSHQSHSLGWALRYEGWKVEQTNEQTKESFYWKP